MLQQRILKEILPEIEDTVYRPQELIPLLHDELLTLVQQSGSYKGLANFERITKRRKPALILRNLDQWIKAGLAGPVFVIVNPGDQDEKERNESRNAAGIDG